MGLRASVTVDAFPGKAFTGTVSRFAEAVDLATRKILWRFRTPGHVYSSPAVVEGSVYFGCLDGCVYALR